MNDTNWNTTLPRVALVVLCTTLPACKSGAEKVIDSYLNQETCADRANFILEPDRHRDALKSWYKKLSDCVTEHGEIHADDCKDVAVGAYCSVSVDKLSSDYCIKRTGEQEYKIDWPCSVGWNEKPLKVVKAEQPSDGTILRVEAELHDHYPDGIDREETVSMMAYAEGDSDRFYMAWRYQLSSKSTITDENARKLKELLSDGKKHKVTVEVSYRKRGHADALPFVTWFVQDGWRSLSEDDLKQMEQAKQEALKAQYQQFKEFKKPPPPRGESPEPRCAPGDPLCDEL